MAPLQVELVAADRKVWSGEASQVSARTLEGDLGILVSGEVRIDSGGTRHVATVDGGFLSVDRDNVTIVAEAVDASQIDG